MILLDTHIWLWFLSGDAQLRPDLRTRIEETPDEVILSPVSLWEALVLARKGRIRFKDSAERTLRSAVDSHPFRSAPLTNEIIFLSESLNFHHQDPADRFLAATATAYGAQLATDDKNLRKLSWLKCV